ncbi:unnamed protein product [Aphanomyces euteiches]|nr:hypothetical protein AeRB84_002404 [Aphanomyces euteiches]
MQSDGTTGRGTPDDAQLARRQYFQKKQREYRRRVKSKHRTLLEDFARFQNHAANRRTGDLVDYNGMLSWKVVASVFREASGDAKKKKTYLRDLTDANLALIYEMMRFLRACRPRPIASLSNAPPLHQHATLLAKGEARAHSKRWLAQQLYYNTDRFFDNFPAVDASDEFVDCNAECAGPWVNSIETCQVTWPFSVEEVKEHFVRPEHQTSVCDHANAGFERDGNTVVTYGLDDDNDPWHYLHGYFYEADRFVVIFRRIHDDEAHLGPGDPDIHEFQWIDIRRLSATRSLVRFLTHRSNLLEDLREYARESREHLKHEDLDEKTIEREVAARDKEILWKFQQDLHDALARLSTCSIHP